MPPDQAADLPVIDLVCERRTVVEKWHPGRERCRADRVIADRTNPLLDALPFEGKDDEVVAKVDGVSRQAEVRWIEGRTLGDQLGRPLVRSLPQLQGDDQPLHGSIIGLHQRRRAMCRLAERHRTYETSMRG